MPQWAGSCWYYLRYCNPHDDQAPISEKAERYWQYPDLYIGGAEHAVLHLLYARFWHKVLFDCGVVKGSEPFKKLFHQGIILGQLEFTGYKKDGKFVTAARASEEGVEAVKLTENDVEKVGANFVLKADKTIFVDARSFKMSKSRGNVVNPDDIIAKYGADSLRLYEMFLGPLEDQKPWNTNGIEGVVDDIRILSTKLVTLDNKIVYIPNGMVSSGTITNFSREDKRRVDLVFSISYEQDFRKAIDIINGVIGAHPLTVKEAGAFAPFARVSNLGASSVDITMRVWTKTSDYWTVYHDMIENVKTAFDKNGIEIPYSKLDVNIKNNA